MEASQVAISKSGVSSNETGMDQSKKAEVEWAGLKVDQIRAMREKDLLGCFPGCSVNASAPIADLTSTIMLPHYVFWLPDHACPPLDHGLSHEGRAVVSSLYE